ncbi:hypothetical protein BDA96_05G136200 [Sorghum bicolor]|uniref:Uncharacterized protein n=2 Tax=Sorghum bicolor TaxID=4558 RepID=A0A921UGP1_SORBI|nr:hypothetical protein BDA96_05G136200 [Sorghum bicolor]OQU83485.1 hypothetical protein SORBI_3005G123450 [Sorghum bicolor]
MPWSPVRLRWWRSHVRRHQQYWIWFHCSRLGPDESRRSSMGLRPVRPLPVRFLIGTVEPMPSPRTSNPCRCCSPRCLGAWLWPVDQHQSLEMLLTSRHHLRSMKRHCLQPAM